VPSNPHTDGVAPDLSRTGDEIAAARKATAALSD
jgi:hypothetical protein